MTTQSEAIARFHELHESGCFVLPNPWDVGSARYLHHLGFHALATTSAGFAFSRGLPDSSAAIPLDMMLDHLREIAHATDLPVNADFQDGYAKDPDGVARNVARCIETGVAGFSIEDSTGDRSNPLYETKLAVERVRAARAASDASGVPVLLTARCEAWLVGAQDPRTIVHERLVAYAEAGADCLYAPGIRSLDEIEALVKLVHPKPINVLVSAPGLTVAQLEGVGVRRISVGSALARVAWGAFIDAARRIAEEGTFESFGKGAANADLNALFREPLIRASRTFSPHAGRRD